MASHGHGPPDDPSSQLSSTIETETAWGRSRFTEAEIKIAFELRDHELRRAEDEAAAVLASKSAASNATMKGDAKRAETKKTDARRKEEAKIKKKDESKPGTLKKGAIGDPKQGEVGMNAAQALENAEQESWRAIMTYNFSQDAQDLASLMAEQKRAESFEEWALAAPTNIVSPKKSSKPVFESVKYQSAIEGALHFLQGSSCTFSMLSVAAVNLILGHLDAQTLISAAQSCRRFRDYSRIKEHWKSRFFALEKKIFESTPDTNIWTELGTNFATLTRDQQGQVKETSLNKLVAAITPQAELPDMMDVSTFLVTYQTFTTTAHLIRKLMQRYMVPEKPGASADEAKTYTTSVVRPIQVRVAKIFKQVLEAQYRDIDDGLLELMKVFVLGIVDQTILAKQCQQGVQIVIAKRNAQRELAAASSISAATSSTSAAKKPTLMGSVYDLSSDEIARHLTLIEFEVYSQIKPTEFFGQAWAKPKHHHRAPNIRAMIDRFNAITRWITTEIVSEERIRNRVKRYMKFIKIAQALRQMHNYHTLMAILGGLNEGPVYRLKFTKAEIPPKFQQAMTELQTVMSADGSYNAYRLELGSATPPCIPYLGVYLRDLTYFDEGGGGSDGMINFKSKKNVYSVIQIIQKYQATPYPFKPTERAYNHLKSISGLDDALLHKTSLLREPKNAKRADLA